MDELSEVYSDEELDIIDDAETCVAWYNATIFSRYTFSADLRKFLPSPTKKHEMKLIIIFATKINHFLCWIGI